MGSMRRDKSKSDQKIAAVLVELTLIIQHAPNPDAESSACYFRGIPWDGSQFRILWCIPELFACP